MPHFLKILSILLFITIIERSLVYGQNMIEPCYSTVDSTKDDISYLKYSSYLDTTKGAVEYDENNNPVDIEPTFADRYFKNRQIDTTGKTYIKRAYTAREIAKCLICYRFGKEKLIQIDKFTVILVDNKFWSVIFNLNEKEFGSTNVILISKYNGQILEWDNLQ